MTFLGIGEVAVNEETFNNGVLIEIDNSGNSMGMVREYTIKGNNQFNYKSIGKIDLKEILSKKTSKEVETFKLKSSIVLPKTQSVIMVTVASEGDK